MADQVIAPPPCARLAGINNTRGTDTLAETHLSQTQGQEWR